MGRFVRTLTITYDLDIGFWEMPLFRGAVIRAMGAMADVLFHNHTDSDRLRYAYPLIQYKRIGNKASIVAIDQGADVVGQFASCGCNMLQIGQREVSCNVLRIQPCRVLVQLWESLLHYRLCRWMPLNDKNYAIYCKLETPIERKNLLESILRGNLLAMLKGMGVWLDGNLVVKINYLSEPFLLQYKGVRLMAFNIDFESNLSIPTNLGVGRHVSVGFGTIKQCRENQTGARVDEEKNEL